MSKYFVVRAVVTVPDNTFEDGESALDIAGYIEDSLRDAIDFGGDDVATAKFTLKEGDALLSVRYLGDDKESNT